MGLFTIAQIEGDPDLSLQANLLTVTATHGANVWLGGGGLSLEGRVTVSEDVTARGNITAAGRVTAGGGLVLAARDGSAALDVHVGETGDVVLDAGGRRVALGSQLVARASQLRVLDDSGGGGGAAEGTGTGQLPPDISIAEYMQSVVRASLQDPTFLLGLRDIITAHVEALQAAAAPTYTTLEPGPVVS